MIHRLYYTKPIKKNVVLDREESRHAKVLRLKIGEEVEIFDGKGTVSKGKIKVSGKAVKVQIFETKKEKREKPFVELWTAVPKGERGDWLIEKATEAGVDKIVSIIFKRSIVIPKKQKIERWKKIATAASAQSKRAYVPEILESIEFNKAMKKVDGQLLICSKDGKKICDVTLKEKVILLVGPEGGFSNEELEQLKKYDKIKLNENILRTETAGVIGVGVLRSS